MGLFDSLKRNSKPAPTRPNEQQESRTANSPTQRYDEVNEAAQVVERDVHASSGAEEAAVYIKASGDAPAPVHVEEEVYAEEPIEPAKASYVAFRDKGPVSHIIGQTKILAIINQKGGVGKSTTAVNLAAALGAAGKEVLLVDLDPQGNATSGYGIDKRDIDQCVYNVLLGETPIEDVILAEVGKGVDVLPSTISLAGAEVELVNEMARENRLKNALGTLRGRYDYILIDCPPSLGLLTINALVAADKLLIPIQCEFYALEGVTKLLDSMKRVKSVLNPSLDIYGIVLTMYDARTNLSKQVVDEVRSFFGDTVFETVIPRTVKLSEAPSYGQPILDYAPENKGTEAYNELAQEVIKRG
ncbi:ParA family protein [Anaerotardibacter muris]|uniref:ParA family protein n=1 Tax=Anaerotardibacter muris TaxID=2941505 RepID=UPI003B84972E